MEKKQEQDVRVKVKKISIRGDEIAILFFSLVSLAFLFISFFRLFAVGKLFDDFIFLFLFGWSKYLVYLFLFIFILPICFNYYFRFKFTFITSSILVLFAISWLVLNVNLVVKDSDIWLKMSPFTFKDFTNYFETWWKSSIINNYHGFFAKPFSFESWNDINSFFPNYGAGGVVGNFLVALTSYGTFLTNFILNLIIFLISVSWLFFNKPWLIFMSIGFLFKPFVNSARKNKMEHLSEKSLENKIFLDFQEEYQKVRETTIDYSTSDIRINKTSVDKKVEPKNEIPRENPKPKNKEIIIHKIIQESGNLTPFGKVNKDQTIEIDFDEEIQESN